MPLTIRYPEQTRLMLGPDVAMSWQHIDKGKIRWRFDTNLDITANRVVFHPRSKGPIIIDVPQGEAVLVGEARVSTAYDADKGEIRLVISSPPHMRVTREDVPMPCSHPVAATEKGAA